MNLRTVVSILVLTTLSTPSWARDYQFQLAAGSSYVEADFNMRHPLEVGYLRTGIGGVYRDWDHKRYQMLHGTIGVGADAGVKGLHCDLGFRGLVGQVEKNSQDGTVGGLGFNASAGYTLPEKVCPLPLEVFGELTWVPDILAFAKLDHYHEFTTGVSLHVVENAAIIAAYRYRKFSMDTHWNLSDGIASLGLAVNF